MHIGMGIFPRGFCSRSFLVSCFQSNVLRTTAPSTAVFDRNIRFGSYFPLILFLEIKNVWSGSTGLHLKGFILFRVVSCHTHRHIYVHVYKKHSL